MARPRKYDFYDSLNEVGETVQLLVQTKDEVAKIRNSVTQWARRTKVKVVTRTLAVDNGIRVTIELVESGTTN